MLVVAIYPPDTSDQDMGLGKTAKPLAQYQLQISQAPNIVLSFSGAKLSAHGLAADDVPPTQQQLKDSRHAISARELTKGSIGDRFEVSLPLNTPASPNQKVAYNHFRLSHTPEGIRLVKIEPRRHSLVYVATAGEGATQSDLVNFSVQPDETRADFTKGSNSYGEVNLHVYDQYGDFIVILVTLG